MDVTHEPLRTRPRPDCLLCGTRGRPLHRGLRDRLFGVPGEWAISRCPAPDCGLVWLDPMPIAEDLIKAYATYHTHAPPDDAGGAGLRRFYYRWLKEGYHARRYGYAAAPPEAVKRWLGLLLYLWPERREFADLQVMELRARPGARLLDVGCGSGALLRFLGRRGWKVEGVDFDPAAVETARRDGLTVHLGSLQDQHFPDGRFDAVTMSHTIEHVAEPLGLLHEIRRVLAPGGQLVAVTPNVESWGHARFGPAWRGLEPPRHLHLFSPRTVRRAAEQAGFRICSVRTSPRSGTQIYRESVAPLMHGSTGERRDRVLRIRLSAGLFNLAGYARILLRPEGGEEVVLTARR